MSTTAAALKSQPKADEDPQDPPKKSKKKLFIIIAVLVLLIGGYEAKAILLAPHYKPGQKVPMGKILPLDQLTVNMSDGHLVQASISLQLSSVAAPSTMSSDLPRFDDAAIGVLSTQTYQGLLPAAAREHVKQEILQDCQKIAGTVDGAAQQVTAIYFTGFVLQ
ncbi:MAG TPA: flagellar basal body-associated FliL family protein [Acidimicrobiales bacterium]|nr:flagellar basal body-associated FliL family protein [Acidimicrobiales bacterium]